MKFIINNRDGPGRTGELFLENQKIITPNILFLNTSRVQSPKFANIIITNKKTNVKKKSIYIGNSTFISKNNIEKEKFCIDNFLIYPKDVNRELHLRSIKNNCKKLFCYITPANIELIDNFLKDNESLIYIVENAYQLYTQQSKFVEFIVKLRDRIGYQKLIYTPSIGCPNNVGLLSYMGIDLFDSISCLNAARNEIIFTPTGNYVKSIDNEIACSCPICNELEVATSDLDFNQTLNHNYYCIINEIKSVRNAINHGCLRELIDTRIRSDPHLVSLLRILDMKNYEFYENRIPIIKKNTLLATSKESLFRPEIKRFQKRLLERYLKPKSAKVLLLLPCSAKKPYSFSKSHKILRNVLYKIKNPHVIHEVIVTSPIGIVPRELELIYPASNYDISVTGHWDEDEKLIIRNLLKNYLKNNYYEKSIIHLPSDLKDIVNDIFEDPIVTCVGKPISNESLDELSTVVSNISKRYDIVKSSTRQFENVGALAAYQFGIEISKKLLYNCKIKGKYPFQKIIENNTQLGMITMNRGLISLTFEGAKKISEFGEYWVEVYNDFTLKGSVFAPGVKDSDESIRIGDEIIIFRNKKLIAVGIAQMNGEEMKESNYGEAIKIRHRI